MSSPTQYNERGLPRLDPDLLNQIFEQVYPQDTNEIADEETRALVDLLHSLQSYNKRYRMKQAVELFPIFERTVGPMEINSEGTDHWLAMGLAIQELYGIRRQRLETLLRQVTIRK